MAVVAHQLGNLNVEDGGNLEDALEGECFFAAFEFVVIALRDVELGRHIVLRQVLLLALLADFGEDGMELHTTI